MDKYLKNETNIDPIYIKIDIRVMNRGINSDLYFFYHFYELRKYLESQQSVALTY